MTRTQRNIYPAALAKDRSVSRSGLDKSLPKKGAGAGNWGSMAQETERYLHGSYDNHKDMGEVQRDVLLNTTNSIEAIEVKKTGAKEQKPKARRMSSMSDEERKEAVTFRKGAMGRQGLDLNAIARTSGAFSQSPPETNILSSSPVRNMNALAQKLDKY